MRLTNLNESVSLPTIHVLDYHRSPAPAERVIASGSAYDLRLYPTLDGLSVALVGSGVGTRSSSQVRLSVTIWGRKGEDPTGYYVEVKDSRSPRVTKTVSGRFERAEEVNGQIDGIVNRLMSDLFGKLDLDDKDAIDAFLNKRLVPTAKRIIPDAKYDRSKGGGANLLVKSRGY